MTNSTPPTRHFAWSQSIRWQLPLTYAAIVLLTVFTLAGVLLLALNQYYITRETAYMTGNARAFADRIESLYAAEIFNSEKLAPILLPVSFLSRSRIRILDPAGEVILDSLTAENSEVIIFSLEPGLDAQLMPRGNADPVDLTGGPDSIQVGRLQARQDNYDGRGRPPGQDYMFWASDAPFGYDFGQVGERHAPQYSNVVVSVPLHNPEGEFIGSLELSEGPAFGTDVVQSVIRHLLLAAALVVPLATLIGWVISRNLSQPIMRLTHATEQMAEGDLSTRVQIDRADELGQLSTAFNGMAAQIETTVSTLQQFVADAAHEIKTPITAMRTNLELAEAGVQDENSRSDLVLAQRELNRLEQLTSSLLALARLESGGMETAHEPLDIAHLIRQMHEQFASRAEQAGITLTTENINQVALIAGNQRQLIRMLENLIDNALKFTPEGGSVTIALASDSGSDSVQIRVQDTGIGIPEADLPRLFSRFHRGRNASAYPGNGLGLVIARTIIEEHGGSIAVQSSAQGTAFIASLPRCERQDKRT
ncbi:MAG: HAMP domain-containing histidine kinase [Anaerolineae bacterium]|nr:HAMP domain-containing histidine kinase [Anaerolineae bacterium]